MRRWRILFTSLLVTAVVLAARYVVHEVLGLTTDVVWDDIQVVTTGASVIIGLMLVGVLREYGDAEQLPVQVASAISTFDRLVRNAAAAGHFDSSPFHGAISGLAGSIGDWLYVKKPDAQVEAEIDAIRKSLVELQKLGASDVYLGRCHVQLDIIDGAVDRMMSIRNSMYLQSGYTLMYVLTSIVIVLLLVVDFGKAGLAPWLMSGSLTMIYTYLILLIRDLDNPFAYGRRQGVAEVDLSPLHAVREDLRSRG
jgi:hypothetical protein